MESEMRAATLAPWKIRLLGFALVLFGGFMSGFSWAALQRPDVKMTCQYEHTADPPCKKAGIWGGLIFVGFGLHILLAPGRWLRPRNRNVGRGRQ
jgi:hypothetical protein